MQAAPGPQRASQRRSPTVETGQPSDTQNPSGGGMSAMSSQQVASGPRSSSGSARSQTRQVNVSRRPSLHRPQYLLPERVRSELSPIPAAPESQETQSNVKKPY